MNCPKCGSEMCVEKYAPIGKGRCKMVSRICGYCGHEEKVGGEKNE
jgi:hypothetical protein